MASPAMGMPMSWSILDLLFDREEPIIESKCVEIEAKTDDMFLAKDQNFTPVDLSAGMFEPDDFLDRLLREIDESSGSERSGSAEVEPRSGEDLAVPYDPLFPEAEFSSEHSYAMSVTLRSTNSPSTESSASNESLLKESLIQIEDDALSLSQDSAKRIRMDSEGTNAESDSSEDGFSSRPQKTQRRRNTRDSGNLLPLTTKDLDGKDAFPFLNLSEEERRLIEREGIQLPTKYPLTRAEEKDLRRIRRKIRNKRSAQESRKRKQVYVEALEQRVNLCTSENRELQKKVEELSQQNKSLLTQLKKLQASVGIGGKRSAQAGACLAVLLFSFVLLVAPNYTPWRRDAVAEQQKIQVEVEAKAPLAGHTRTLLQVSETADEQETPAPVPFVFAPVNKMDGNFAPVEAEEPSGMSIKRIKLEPAEVPETGKPRTERNATYRPPSVYVVQKTKLSVQEL